LSHAANWALCPNLAIEKGAGASTQTGKINMVLKQEANRASTAKKAKKSSFSSLRRALLTTSISSS
jgi:hypothetical protein